MTHNGQGDEPSPRPAREGIVLPSDGGEPLLPGQAGDRTTPAGGQAWDRPWGPGPTPQGSPEPGQGWAPAGEWGAGAPDPNAQQPAWGAQPQAWGGQAPQAPQAPQYTAQDNGQAGPYGAGGATGHGYGTAGAADAYGSPGAPQAPPVDEGATQFLPPVPASPVDEGATQFLPPVGPGALPPERPADGMPAAAPGESTQYLGRVPQDGSGAIPGGNGAGPLPGSADPDAQPTQFMAPVPGQPGAEPYAMRPGVTEERQQQPPAEFDNLFRSDAAGPTRQQPGFDQPRGRQAAAPGHGPAPARPGGPGAPDGHGARRGPADGGGRGGSRSRVPLIAAVGVGIAVLGIGAGALLSGGGDGGDDDSRPVGATAPATDASSAESGSPESADPAKAQAVALDKLLADSGNSRDSVVRAVENVRKCSNLGQAATDLRNAAKQRNGLVTRLAALSVDKLPDHAQLTASLNSAWKASASADTHYAAWADQVADRKGCRKGQARTTGQTAAGNRESVTATAQKGKAAKLWNSVASTYGLTERQPGQL
ncbi:hypothetical protein [Streptomyces fructofermentans]|uniref:Uncharacterized protein n=1 Tax=Streptomyces fructofermentans TaxID=152141 RepID=A0A918K4Y9_9ACTN|nr:hypothetical protein [Streptomyces fructofermentans]GGX46616.1 hypothetical protein GCM10010515_11870 [Streptomyces fructofermentans]